jgi:hypothetical protein
VRTLASQIVLGGCNIAGAGRMHVCRSRGKEKSTPKVK